MKKVTVGQAINNLSLDGDRLMDTFNFIIGWAVLFLSFVRVPLATMSIDDKVGKRYVSSKLSKKQYSRTQFILASLVVVLVAIFIKSNYESAAVIILVLIYYSKFILKLLRVY